MSSPNGEKPFILYDLMRVADFRFLEKPLRLGRRRRVHFNNIVEVFDVISRDEIEEHNLKHLLWWNIEDFQSVQLDVCNEVQRFLNKYPGVDYYSARKIICNPHYTDSIETINE